MALNLYTIAPDADFIGTLVDAVLKGFPLAANAERPALQHLTILVPNRRTARALHEAFVGSAKGQALLLPRIRPIGDLDDEFAPLIDEDDGATEAISTIGQHFLLIGLVREWASNSRHLPLAEALLRSPSQMQALAGSLTTLLDSLDIEEQPVQDLRIPFELEIAAHQEAIRSLLAVLHQALPARMAEAGFIGGHRRRSLAIRRAADALTATDRSHPVIAAGSTGTIPATRHLLKTIAQLPHGAVVLPGLDSSLPDECWDAVTPQHPQFAMKQLLEEMGANHRSVPRLGHQPGARAWLASEIMRPSGTSHEWARIIPPARKAIAAALSGLEMLECRDSEEEAATLATLVRLKLAEGCASIAIATPDPLMARRVTAQLARWNITPANSAGEPLPAFGAARYLMLLIGLLREPQSAAALSALVLHPATRFGRKAEDAARLAALTDMTLLRSPLLMLGLSQLPELADRMPEAVKAGFRLPPQAPQPGSSDWAELHEYVTALHGHLAPLCAAGPQSFDQHLAAIIETAQDISAADFWRDEAANHLLGLIASLSAESGWLGEMSLREAADLLDDYLRREPFRPRIDATAGVSIIGLLEARLQRHDCVVLAGLAESVWPGAADSGPWLNRPMRDKLKIKQPEAKIGQMAHDFVQAFGAPQLVLSWSREEAGQPLTPSRWLLRLRAILKAAGCEEPMEQGKRWRAFAALLEAPEASVQIPVPAPKPPAEARLSRISFTQADKLIVDPYQIYAASVLKLRPLNGLAGSVNYALRGEIFHRALAVFFQKPSPATAGAREALLLEAGRQAFKLLPDAAIVRNSWWPRYERVAQWLAQQENLFGDSAAAFHPEARVAVDLAPVASARLSGRADLVRIGEEGSAAVFDFKTGDTPAVKQDSLKFSYQLTLEAAAIERAGLAGRGDLQAVLLAYVKVSGGIPAGEINCIDDAALANRAEHLAGLARLMAQYAAADQPFLPHANARAGYVGDYDQLSRHAEWKSRGLPA